MVSVESVVRQDGGESGIQNRHVTLHANQTRLDDASSVFFTNITTSMG